MTLKDTLNLPDPASTIPMKANLPELEPKIQAQWAELGIYEFIQESRKGQESFVLHDGPPYTNSPIHVGTALNKILKDFVVKSQTLLGKRAPYVPGYDNHGLPIELAVQKKFADQGVKDVDIPTLRKACREHAEKYIGIQTEQFQRLGVFGMWDNPYTSMEFAYEAEIIRIFKRLVEGGYVYRGLRPVLWSPSSQTALADTETVYQDVVSKAIYVKFPLHEDKNGLFVGLENVNCVIWTTTPWTIPANLAVAFHPDLTYDVVQAGKDHLILIHQLVDKVMEACGISEYKLVKSFRGSEVEYSTFKHPVFDRDSLAVLAQYVTTEDGTGVVHTAPGHGRDDFYTGQKYGLPVLCPVNERGVLTEEAGEFAGVYYKKCDTVVVDRLSELGMLMHVEDYSHSYPHAERDGQPVIFRATEQWFIGMDKPFHLDHSVTLRQKMLAEIDQVKWHPAQSVSRIRSMIENRPDWCISRQRPWGVGIPVIYGADSGVPVLDPAVISSIADHIQQHGSDSWYVDPAEAFLPDGYVHTETGETSFSKEVDVFDVWFDSGSTHLAVLEGNVEPAWKEPLPADLFLEGTDQHRGWFNVSMILGTACRGGSPYREVLTHGFVLDGQGRKMSKRLGNVVDPIQASDQYGADILRYWAASVNYADDVPCSDELLKVAGEGYRTVRNTIRFLIANLSDFDSDAPYELSLVDRWIMQSTDQLVKSCRGYITEYQFNKMLGAIHGFCVNELSRFYLDSTKDTMYCDLASWPSRRGAQKACHYVVTRLVPLIAPFLVHTAEEAYGMIPGIDHKKTVHVETLPDPTLEFDEDLSHLVESLMSIRAKVFSEFESWKAISRIKNSEDVQVQITLPQEDVSQLNTLKDDLPILFKMADVAVSEGEFACTFQESKYLKCDRSRVRRADVQPVEWEGQAVNLSARDRRALGLES